MGKIKLHNIRVFAYHGCLDEESKIGSNYIVNISVKADLQKASQLDKLSETVDYVALNAIVVREMAIRADLLETVAQRIIDSVLRELQEVSQISVEVSKLNPPIGGDVESVTIKIKHKR
jgi:7,8-dihydroneopterin aldolase/epimerase/oxygenase